eukprot:TRINITY_DN7144_c0_g1_i1.p2 TRINITY_DN7144_c0_g1~~TRINITY_DN7144_c0_g1_i1.p2  ORF type:complete len:332 (+),score=-30.39 TRINITY_DN7144_c0_g1_i1:2210-3205(+)
MLAFITDFLAPITLLVTALLSVALITLVERKVLAALQRRTGPNVVGYYGIAQPFADALKLIIKETITAINSNGFLFFVSPLMIFFLAMLSWAILLFEEKDMIYDFPLNGLVIALITSLMGQYILFSGWSSGSRYALLGSLRATAQFISYEMFISLALLNVTLYHQTLNISEIIYYQEEETFNFFLFIFSFVFFFIAIMAETNRPPFDLPEAEGELVAGYHVEYTSLPFAFFYISEYANFFFNSVLISVMFLFLPSHITSFFLFNFDFISLIWLIAASMLVLQICIRASFPRYMIESIMEIGWKLALPINLAMIFLVVVISYFSVFSIVATF